MYDVCQELRLSYTFGIGMNSRLRGLSDDLLKTGRRGVRADRAAAAAVPGGRVSGRELAGAAAGRHQGRSACPGDQSASRGHESAGLGGPAAGGVRRVRRARREREPQQGTEERTASRSPQRPPVPGELLPIISSCGRVEPAGAAAACGRPSRPQRPPSWACRPSCRPPRSTSQIASGSSTSDVSATRWVKGFACTWRTRLIKVAAEVITRARRVIVRLSASWPHLDHFLAVSRIVSAPAPAPSSG